MKFFHSFLGNRPPSPSPSGYACGWASVDLYGQLTLANKLTTYVHIVQYSSCQPTPSSHTYSQSQ